jgi:predicted nucleotidyltransferase
MLTKNIAIEKASQFIRVLQQNGFAPEKAILFGSTVSNNIHEFSDIDLAIWDKKFVGMPHIDIEKTYKLLRAFKQIELHPYNSADTEETNPFIEVIKKTGIEIKIDKI